ncbi:hypothetical protein ACFQ8E_15045 [Isoptericola sp. NPDC056573]|uniref:hypothetical protein n=1 Tax=Isoptericola sp. NPDC056573 TaxID=3345868 RepID=UPI003688036B
MNQAGLQAVASEPFILLLDAEVTDLDHFAANHDMYLVSMYREPARAAAIWKERLQDAPVGSDGFLSLSYFGREMFAPSLWDEVMGIWYEIVDVIGQFVAQGKGEALFPDQPVEIRMSQQRGGAVFGIHEQDFIVDPHLFVPGVLTEAEKFFEWVERYVNDDRSDALSDIRAIREAWGARS